MQKKMEDRTTISIILERAQVDKIDELAGTHNRSAYIRKLIDAV